MLYIQLVWPFKRPMISERSWMEGRCNFHSKLKRVLVNVSCITLKMPHSGIHNSQHPSKLKSGPKDLWSMRPVIQNKMVWHKKRLHNRILYSRKHNMTWQTTHKSDTAGKFSYIIWLETKHSLRVLSGAMDEQGSAPTHKCHPAMSEDAS